MYTNKTRFDAQTETKDIRYCRGLQEIKAPYRRIGREMKKTAEAVFNNNFSLFIIHSSLFIIQTKKRPEGTPAIEQAVPSGGF